MGRTVPSKIERKLIETNRAVRGLLESFTSAILIFIGAVVASLFPGNQLIPALKVGLTILLFFILAKAVKFGGLALMMRNKTRR